MQWPPVVCRLPANAGRPVAIGMLVVVLMSCAIGQGAPPAPETGQGHGYMATEYGKIPLPENFLERHDCTTIAWAAYFDAFVLGEAGMRASDYGGVPAIDVPVFEGITSQIREHRPSRDLARAMYHNACRTALAGGGDARLSLAEAERLVDWLAFGQLRVVVHRLFDGPDRTEQAICDEDTDAPWACRVHDYGWDRVVLQVWFRRYGDAWLVDSWRWNPP